MFIETQTPFVDEDNRVWSMEELEELIQEWSDVMSMSNLLESNMLTMSLTEYYEAPAKLMDLVMIHRAYVNELQLKEMKDEQTRTSNKR